MVLKKSAAYRSLDNITVLILGLKNFKKSIEKMNEGVSYMQLRDQTTLDKRLKNTINEVECFDVVPEELSFM